MSLSAVLEETYKCAMNDLSSAYDITNAFMHYEMNLSAIINLESLLALSNSEDHSGIEPFGQIGKQLGALISTTISQLMEQQQTIEPLGQTSVLMELWQQAIQSLQENGYSKLSQLTHLFLITILYFIDNPTDESYCHVEMISGLCPICFTSDRSLSWKIINTLKRPKLYEQVQTLELFMHRCRYCGTKHFNASYPLFFCCPAFDQYIIVDSRENRRETVEFQQKILEYMNIIPREFRNQKTSVAFVENCSRVGLNSGSVSAYERRAWFNADDVNIVHYVHDVEGLQNFLSYDNLVGAVMRKDDDNATQLYSQAQGHFSKGDFRKAAICFAKVFLRDQTYTEALSHLCASLHSMEQHEAADTLKAKLDALEIKLRQVGIIMDNSVIYPGTLELTKMVHARGLPKEWGFQDLILNLKGITKL